MKYYKTIQIEASVPSETGMSECHMLSIVVDLQKNDGYTVDSVTVSNPVLVSTTTGTLEGDGRQKSENSYVVPTTYVLSKFNYSSKELL